MCDGQFKIYGSKLINVGAVPKGCYSVVGELIV